MVQGTKPWCGGPSRGCLGLKPFLLLGLRGVPAPPAGAGRASSSLATLRRLCVSLGPGGPWGRGAGSLSGFGLRRCLCHTLVFPKRKQRCWALALAFRAEGTGPEEKCPCPREALGALLPCGLLPSTLSRQGAVPVCDPGPSPGRDQTSGEVLEMVQLGCASRPGWTWPLWGLPHARWVTFALASVVGGH